MNTHPKKTYLAWYIACSILNIIFPCILYAVSAHFVAGDWASYGPEVLRAQFQPVPLDPMCRAFPKVASCEYMQFAGSGSAHENKVICVLPMNQVNDKVFFVLWWWYVFVAACAVVTLVETWGQVSH